jgi:chorismate mutase/prephenate dehydratase
MSMAKKRTSPKKIAKSTSTKSRTMSTDKHGPKYKPTIKQLEKLDREILTLINRRAELQMQRIIRDQQSDPGSSPHHNLPTQDDLASLERLANTNRGPLESESVRAVFREIYSGCRAVGHAPRVAFLGPDFTYSHLAAIEKFGQSASLVPVGSIAAVFEEVEREQVEFGLVPVDNSTDGRIMDTLDCLTQARVKICAEIPLRIRHYLLGSGCRQDLRHVYSKPQALSQCRSWLGKHLPEAELHGVASTAEAAHKAVGDRSIGAIASRQAGINHALTLLARDIQDNSDNVTRFMVIGRDIAPRSGNDKTSIVFEVAHYPGALADAMVIFKRNQLNLTWIESFPVPGCRGRYLFFIEFQGYPTELRPKRALASLAKKALRLDVLGSYAQADPIG